MNDALRRFCVCSTGMGGALSSLKCSSLLPSARGPAVSPAAPRGSLTCAKGEYASRGSVAMDLLQLLVRRATARAGTASEFLEPNDSETAIGMSHRFNFGSR